MHAQDLLSADEIGRRHEHLPVEAAGTQQGRIEILEAVRSAHDHHAVVGGETVQLHQQLVEGLVLLAVEAVTRASCADSVELVDEDDRRRVLSSLGEELANSRRAETGEHLDERGRALREERGTRLVSHRLREQRLARSGGPVEQDALGHAGAELLEALRVAQEVDDLLQLDLDLCQAGNVVPRDARARSGGGALGVDPRRELHDAPEEVHHQAHEDQREPDQEHAADVVEDRSHDQRIGSGGLKP